MHPILYTLPAKASFRPGRLIMFVVITAKARPQSIVVVFLWEMRVNQAREVQATDAVEPSRVKKWMIFWIESLIDLAVCSLRGMDGTCWRSILFSQQLVGALVSCRKPVDSCHFPQRRLQGPNSNCREPMIEIET